MCALIIFIYETFLKTSTTNKFVTTGYVIFWFLTARDDIFFSKYSIPLSRSHVSLSETVI